MKERMLNSRHAVTSAPLIEPIASRWSPRAFDPTHSLPHATLESILEAARWAASANNTQPWRFVVARRGGVSFPKVEEALLGFNREWAARASALLINIARVRDEQGKDLAWAKYDLGQAVASYSIQARAEGLFVHQMGGFKTGVIREAFDLSEDYAPVSITALGMQGDIETLPEPLREREQGQRVRKPLADLLMHTD